MPVCCCCLLPEFPAQFSNPEDNPANYFQNITTDQATNPWFRSVSASMQRANCMSNETRQQYDYGSFFEAFSGNCKPTGNQLGNQGEPTGGTNWGNQLGEPTGKATGKGFSDTKIEE